MTARSSSGRSRCPMAKFTWDGVSKLLVDLQALANPDPTPLLEEWQRIIEEDNRKGVLAGLDKDGTPMTPVKYRPKTDKPRKPTKEQTNAAPKGVRGIFAGMGPSAAGLHNNLTSAEYRKLGGPPLAPRGKFSRVI